jgi:hypothetical protein
MQELRFEVRVAPINGHRQLGAVGPTCASFRHDWELEQAITSIENRGSEDAPARKQDAGGHRL